MFLFNEVYSRIKLASILMVIAYLVIASSKKTKNKSGKVPLGPTMTHEESTTCPEFARYGRFNPYSVLNAKWFVFYYWAPVRTITTYIFTAPSSNHTRKLKKLFEGNCVLPVQWHERQLLMEDNRKFISLLVERSDRGEYWQYPVARVRKGQKITPRDVRLKQTGDNRLLGFFDCHENTLIVMSRINDVPPKGRLHEEASRLGYRGTKGKSYLYQGHEWGPVDEADEDHFWNRRKTISNDASTEDKSSEGSSEVAEQSINKPEHSETKNPKPKKGAVLGPGIPKDDETCAKVMPELWNDPEPNPNPDNLLTKEDLNHVDSLIINDNLAIEGPDTSTDSKQETNGDKESKKIPENDKLDNHKDVHKVETPYLTDNKQETKSDKETENLPENRKLCNHKDVHKIEISDSTDNKQESKTDKESENPPENRELHNHKAVHKMETPDSTDNKQERNTDKESENPPEKCELQNHKDVYKMETPHSTDNKQESNTDKESENPLENHELHNHKDVYKMETPDSTDNKQESNTDNKSENPHVHKMVTPNSTENKQETYTDKESENPPKNRELHNHKDVDKMETPDSTDNTQESNTDKESKNPPENRELHNHKDVYKMETPDSTDNKQESNTDKESEKPPENKEPHNYKVCRGTTEPDEDDQNCVVCYKSYHKHASDESYVPVSARSMPDSNSPRIELPKSEETPHTEVPIPKVSTKTSSAEVPTPKVPSDKAPRNKVPAQKVPSAKSKRIKVTTLKDPSAKSPHTKVTTPKVPRTKTPRAKKVPGAMVPDRSPAPPPQDQTNSSEIIHLSPRTLDELETRRTK